jgi:transposase-like protein
MLTIRPVPGRTFLNRVRDPFISSPTCLIKDREALLAFYNFPAEHWKHLRTTNVIESVCDRASPHRAGRQIESSSRCRLTPSVTKIRR